MVSEFNTQKSKQGWWSPFGYTDRQTSGLHSDYPWIVYLHQYFLTSFPNDLLLFGGLSIWTLFIGRLSAVSMWYFESLDSPSIIQDICKYIIVLTQSLLMLSLFIIYLSWYHPEWNCLQVVNFQVWYGYEEIWCPLGFEVKYSKRFDPCTMGCLCWMGLVARLAQYCLSQYNTISFYKGLFISKKIIYLYYSVVVFGCFYHFFFVFLFKLFQFFFFFVISILYIKLHLTQLYLDVLYLVCLHSLFNQM